MNNKGFNRAINVLFFIAIVICIVGLVYALVVFVNNSASIRLSFGDLIASFKAAWTTTDGMTKTDIDQMMSYASRLQELQANAVSTNILTFIYTFLSGVLIGIATYFTKKNYDSLTQIIANKKQLDSLEGELLYATLYQNTIKINSALQIFSLSLTSLHDENTRSDYLNRSIPMLNTSIEEISRVFLASKESIKNMSDVRKGKLLQAIEEVANIVKVNLPNQPSETLLQDAKSNWKTQIEDILKTVP